MRRGIILILAAMVAASPALAGMTARQAWNKLGKQRGLYYLSRMLELRGSFGQPQPGSWRIVVRDPQEPSRTRAFRVTSGSVSTELAPTEGFNPATTLLDTKKIKLDSSRAFAIANAEAKKARISFDSVDYVLRCRDRSTEALYFMDLFDYRKSRVGTLSISAESGRVLWRKWTPPTGTGGGKPPKKKQQSSGSPNAWEKGTDSVQKAGANVGRFFSSGWKKVRGR